MTGARILALDVDIARQYWRQQAACAGLDPRMWDTDSTAELQAAGDAICAGCPVRTQCLADAEAGHDYGTRRAAVGLTASDLRRHYRKQYLTPCAWCGRVFLGKAGRKYCGRSCAGYGTAKAAA